jgi:RNA polymerase sigma factor (sigma-70 family)
VSEPSDHLFRHESGRMIAALTRLFGMHNLALAEDVVQDAFCRALEVWKFRGVPDKPGAWLMTTAKRRALDVLRRERTARSFAPDLDHLLESEWTLAPTVEELFAEHVIQDDLLRMMFSCCNPRIPEVAQVALVLHILCGFSVGEVASAFFSGEAAMEKRLGRAKKSLAESKRLFELSDREDLPARLSTVHRALYLLFNEGYHGACAELAVRQELCEEAMRLTRLLVDDSRTSTPATRALLALMHLNAARLPARMNEAGRLISLLDQDRSQWNAAQVAEGVKQLELSARGLEVSEYHLEAAIAAAHASASNLQDTNWEQIVSLYDTLMKLRPSPVIALNRAIALAEWKGPEQGLEAIQTLADVDRLEDYPFYFAAQGELEWRRGRPELAHEHFQKAAQLARNPMEQSFLQERMQRCENKSVSKSQ